MRIHSLHVEGFSFVFPFAHSNSSVCFLNPLSMLLQLMCVQIELLYFWTMPKWCTDAHTIFGLTHLCTWSKRASSSFVSFSPTYVYFPAFFCSSSRLYYSIKTRLRWYAILRMRYCTHIDDIYATVENVPKKKIVVKSPEHQKGMMWWELTATRFRR